MDGIEEKMTETHNKSVLVTGSEGFIGKHLVNRLNGIYREIEGVSRSTSSVDVTEWNTVKDIAPKDIVFHLAGISNVAHSFEFPKEVYYANTVGTLNMLEWCRKNDVELLVYASTFVYGNPQYLPIDEIHPASPNNPYSQSKLLGEELCEAYCRDYGLNAVSLRLFNIYGPNQKRNFLIPDIIHQLESGKVVLKDPFPKRDMIYIDDVIDAFIMASTAGIRGYEEFNIGSGASYSVAEIAEMLVEIYVMDKDEKVTIEYTNEKRRSEIAETVANVEKAKNILKWMPETDIKTGLTKTLRMYLNEC